MFFKRKKVEIPEIPDEFKWQLSLITPERIKESVERYNASIGLDPNDKREKLKLEWKPKQPVIYYFSKTMECLEALIYNLFITVFIPDGKIKRVQIPPQFRFYFTTIFVPIGIIIGVVPICLSLYIRLVIKVLFNPIFDNEFYGVKLSIVLIFLFVLYRFHILR